MNEIIDQLKNLIISNYNQFLDKNGYADRDFFEGEELKNSCRESFKIIFPILFGGKSYNLTETDFNEKFGIALRDVRFNYRTIINPSFSIQNEYIDSWLTQHRIDEIGWNNDEIKTYRARYLKYLEKIGRSKSIITETDRSSLEIIKKIGDPKDSNNFFVKGLVVGSVQSGKTSNFNAVVNSSIDVGYKLIIVLSGIMEDLRKQTQIRTEKEVEGKMIAQDKFIGVGEIASFGQLGQHTDVNQVILPTSTQNDFNRTMQEAHFSLNNTNVLICKKNTSVLQNLLLWLNEYLLENNDKHNLPFLIIDDEADNASINNLGHKGKEYANRINGHIRALLALFNRKTYIGYTATPFANILQDWNKEPDKKWIVKDSKNSSELEFDQVGNLFPDDFIELLNPPSNYIGPKNFFETRIEEVKKIEPLLAEPLSDYIDYFPERVEVLSDGTLIGVKKYNNLNEFLSDPNSTTRFGNYLEYKSATRATTKYDLYPVEIPKSLDEAIKCFIISIAIRLSRRSELVQSKLFHPHNTMLIHISRFSDWQCTTKTLIIKKVEKLQEDLNNDNLVSEESIYKEFERIWIKYYADAINNIKEYLPENYDDEYLTKKSFEEVREFLVSAVKGIEVKAVNTVGKDSLDYESGEKKYIVIGGNKLSRGFTLEGLTINYFIRNTNYADTLLQMGRWFGYRPGYLDCCKLFTTDDTFEKFDQCTATIEELEEEFKKMAAPNNPKDRKKPKDFALRVLTHPGILQITRPSILKNAIVEKWSYSDKLVQTTEFDVTKEKLTNSWGNFKNIYKNYSSHFIFDDKRKFIILKTNINGLEQFINSQNTFTDKFEKNAIIRFVKLCNQFEQLTNWTIAINTSGSARTLSSTETGFVTDVQLTKRTDKSRRSYDSLLNNNKFTASGKSSNIVTSPTDLSLVLTEREKLAAEDEFLANSPGKNPPERIYREAMKDTDGLMVVYLMDLKEIFISEELQMKATAEDINLDIPLIGFAIGIPPLRANFGGQYLVNKHILENIKNGLEDNTEDDIEEEFEEEFEAIESES